MKHLVHQFLFPVDLFEPSSCFFPLFRVYFHCGSFLYIVSGSVDYSTEGATFQVSTKFSITSKLVLLERQRNLTSSYALAFGKRAGKKIWGNTVHNILDIVCFWSIP